MDENKIYNVLIGISILAIIIITVLIFSNPVKEPFTELYFEDFKTLPKIIILNQEYFFSFTIHNKEGKNMNYPTTVTLELDNKIIPIYSQSLFIQDEQLKTTIVPLKIEQNFSKGKISVQLPDHEIHFWVKLR